MRHAKVAQHKEFKVYPMRKNAILITICLLVSTGLALGQKTLSVSSGSGFPGDTVPISVNFSDGSGVGGLQFQLNYNSSLLSIFDADGDGNLNEEVTKGSLLTPDHTLTVNASTPGLISAIAVGVTSMNSGPGSVINVTFQIAASAGGGTTPLTLSDIVGSDPLGLAVSVNGSNGSVNIEAFASNDPPNAVNDSGSTNEDQSVTINVVANDTDPDGDTLSVINTTSPAHGSVAIVNSASVRYTPAANYHGSDSFSYTVSDGNGATDQAQVTVTVNPVNDLPVAVNDEAATSEGQAVTIPVLANDSDADEDTLTVTEVTQPSNGSTSINGSTTVTYVPTAGYFGQDSFSYTVSDGNGGTDTANVSVTVTEQNDPPVANDDTASTNEDEAVTINTIANDTDPDGDTLSLTNTTSPAHGSVAIVNSTSVRYVPSPNYHGADSFGYTVSDGKGGTDQAQVTVTVTSVNDRPVANDDTVVSDGSQPLSVAVLSNDNDPDGDTLSISEVGQPAQGSAVINGNTITYTPGANFQGADLFSYTVSDGSLEDSATVTVTAQADNQPPVAVDDTGSTTKGFPVVINVLFNDTDLDGDSLSVVAVGSPSHGSATVYSQSSVRYNPLDGYEGSDAFEYTVSDGQAEAMAIVRVEISAKEESKTLIFPASVKTGDPLFADSYVGVAVLNRKFATETLSLSMLDSGGMQIETLQLGESIPAFGQTSFITSEVFELSPEASALAVEGSGSLQGFFMAGDYQLARLDGVGARVESSRRFYFPILRENGGEVTLLYLVNENSENSTEIDIQVFSQDGSMIGEVTAVLPPQGSMFGTISEILSEVMYVEEGFVKVEADQNIRGFELVASQNSFSALAGQTAVRLRRLWAPQFFFDPQNGGTSILRMLNTDNRKARISLKAFNDESELLGSKIVDIEPQGLWVEDLRNIFEDAPEELVTGFVRLDISGPFGTSTSVLGSITYNGFHGQTSTTLPLIGKGSSEVIFPHLAQTADGSIYTGFSILNPGEDAATVTIEAFRPQGGRCAQKVLEVAPGTRAIDLLRSEMFFGPDFEQLEGHVRIRSTGEVVIFAVFGDYQGKFMSAIEGQPPVD